MLAVLALSALYITANAEVGTDGIQQPCLGFNTFRQQSCSTDEVSTLQTAVDVKVSADEPKQGTLASQETLATHTVQTLPPIALSAEEQQPQHNHSVDVDPKSPQVVAHSAASGARKPAFPAYWTSDFKLVTIEITVLVVIVLLREIGLIRDWFGKQHLKPRHRFYMKCVEILRAIVASADYSFMIPVSLNLSLSLGWNYITSGFLVSAFAAGVGCGTLIGLRMMPKFTNLMKRRILLFSSALLAVSEALLAIMMSDPGIHHVAALPALIILVRVGAGLSAGCGSVHLSMVTQVCSPQEVHQFEAWLPICDLFGLALGPLIVAFMLPNPSLWDFYQASSTPMIGVAALNIVVSVAFSFITPLDLDQVSYLKEDDHSIEDVYEYAPDIMAAEASHVLTARSRGTIAAQTFLQVALCSLATSGSELATSFVMQVEYGWSPASIGIGMCAVFAVTSVALFALRYLRIHVGTVVDKSLGMLCVLAGGLGTFFYFQFDGFIVQLFVGDALIYPSMTAVTGMMVGYALWSSNPCKWNNRENVVISAHVLDSGVKFAGAPLVRALLGKGGRMPYAIMQASLAFLSLLNFILVRFSQMQIDQNQLHDAMLKVEPPSRLNKDTQKPSDSKTRSHDKRSKRPR